MPVVGADEEQMSVSLGTVFLLNSAALLLFSPIGHALGLSQTQFGLWAALAVHDTSSVVGGARLWTLLNSAAKAGLTATLFLIGTGISRATLRKVGLRPLVQGVALWALVASLSLFLTHTGVVF